MAELQFTEVQQLRTTGTVSKHEASGLMSAGGFKRHRICNLLVLHMIVSLDGVHGKANVYFYRIEIYYWKCTTKRWMIEKT